MHLTCGPCVVRSYRAEDLDALVRHANHPAIAANLRDRFPHPYTREAGEEWLSLVLAMRPVISFAIEHEGELVGGIGVNPHQDVERVSAEVGYWLGERVWGRGLATAALTAFSAYAFETFGLTRLYALPFAGNLASRRVLEKAGYRLVGILRRSAIKRGEIIDQALFDLVRDD